ncbi:MAG: hypothetical protein ACJARP_003156 [Vicingaceae bacterium]
MLKIELNPTKDHLSEIKSWLKEERESTGEGFFCNWGVIERAFQNELVLIGLMEDKPIGFIVYYFSVPKLIYHIIEIKPSHRKKRFGKLLFLESIVHFKKKGVKKVEVDSINEESYQFCHNLGFIIDDEPTVKSSNSLKLSI